MSNDSSGRGRPAVPVKGTPATSSRSPGGKTPARPGSKPASKPTPVKPGQKPGLKPGQKAPPPAPRLVGKPGTQLPKPIEKPKLGANGKPLPPGRKPAEPPPKRFRAADVKKALKEGRVAYDPWMVAAYLKGKITLAELQDVPREQLVSMAEMGRRFLAEGKTERALTIFTALAALDPFTAYFLTGLGAAQMLKRDFDAALVALTRAIGINPRFATAHAHRGEAHLEKSMIKEAIQDFMTAIQVGSEDEPAVFRAKVLLAKIEAELKKAELAKPAGP